jgi:hypothetical protein
MSSSQYPSGLRLHAARRGARNITLPLFSASRSHGIPSAFNFHAVRRRTEVVDAMTGCGVRSGVFKRLMHANPNAAAVPLYVHDTFPPIMSRATYADSEKNK